MNPIYILIVLQIADALSTVAFLRQGVATEANYLLRFAMQRLGVVPALVLFKGAAIALLLWVNGQPANETVTTMMWALCALYVWVVVRNVKILKK